MPTIFVSYRRADTQPITDRVYARLAQVFGEKSLFRDVDSIPLAQDFRAAIEKAIILADVLIVVIGQDWLDSVDVNGARRLENPIDAVRLEVETGMRHAKLIVPLLVNGAAMPPADRLPPSMYQLSFINGAVIRPDKNFDADLQRVIDLIAQRLGQQPAASSTPPPVASAPQNPAPVSGLRISGGRVVNHGHILELKVNDHTIRVDTAPLGVKQSIQYDGELKESQPTVWGLTTRFTVAEDGQPAEYEISTRAKGWLSTRYNIVVKRNGVTIYED